jgi:hypothetical protein
MKKAANSWATEPDRSENSRPALMPQMSAQVFFVLARARNVVVAPFAAPTPTADSDTFTARVLVGDRIEERRVKIGDGRVQGTEDGGQKSR